MRVTDSGLGITDLVEGDGAEAVDGAEVAVHYVGKLDDGRVFDSSRERGVPFRFELGSELVIPAWEEGVLGMKVGGKRRLLAPPHLAYGERGHGVIPGGAILEFEIELLEVEPPE
jgi:FKBP-type peptidyl-prolyl cis-trans isomerase